MDRKAAEDIITESLNRYRGLKVNAFTIFYDIKDRYEGDFALDDVFEGVMALDGKLTVYDTDVRGRPLVFSMNSR